jgi:uncharacterized lipoprotein YmbA
MNAVRWSCWVMTALLGSCASTPAHYYTLVPESDPMPPAPAVIPLRLDVARIPAQADRLELVIRLPDRGIAIADGERWIAPVADELQSALFVELSRRLGAARASGPTGQTSVSVRVIVERFESFPSRYALIDASWQLELKAADKDVSVHCRTWAYEQVRDGYPELVRGYQQAVAVIADDIAMVARDSMSGLAAQCRSN